MNTTRISLCTAAFTALAMAAGTALAADPAPSGQTGSSYQKDRADCDAGKTAEDRATCLREAGAAKVERKRDGLAPAARQAAVDRCNALPAKDKADCIARIDGPMQPNQTVTTSGSVAGGGVIRETRTVTPGTVTVVPAASAPKP